MNVDKKLLPEGFGYAITIFKVGDSFLSDLLENLLTIHTHPNSFPPSIDDINSNYDHNYEIGVVVCHDGRVYMYSAEERINEDYYKLTVEDYLKNGYNEDTAQVEALKEMHT